MKNYLVFGLVYGPDSSREMTFEIYMKHDCISEIIKEEIDFYTSYHNKTALNNIIQEKFLVNYLANVCVLFFSIINEDNLKKMELDGYGFESVFRLFELQQEDKLVFCNTPNSSSVIESIEFIISKYSYEQESLTD